MSQSKDSAVRTAETDVALDAVTVGAGFAGPYRPHRLRGLDLSASVDESGGGVRRT